MEFYWFEDVDTILGRISHECVINEAAYQYLKTLINTFVLDKIYIDIKDKHITSDAITDTVRLITTGQVREFCMREMHWVIQKYPQTAMDLSVNSTRKIFDYRYDIHIEDNRILAVITVVIEYLLAEILEQGSVIAKKQGVVIVTPDHIKEVIINDIELSYTFT